MDSSFYLKDFKNNNKLKENNLDIDVYSESTEKLKLDIVLKNGNIYIKSNTRDKIEIVDENSSIEFIDDHYKKIDKADIDKYEFDFKNVINPNIKKKYSSILNPLTLLIKGFKKVFDFSVLKKILLAGFLISGMFIMYSISTICATFNVKDEDFVSINKNYLTVTQKKLNVHDYLTYESIENINYILPGDSLVTLKLNLNDYYQTNEQISELTGSLFDINDIKKSDLILGNMPTNDYEIVVDKRTLEVMIQNTEILKMSGINKYESLLNREITISGMNNFKIVGIVDKKSPSIYVSKNLFINILYNSKNSGKVSDSGEGDQSVMDYTLIQDKIELKQGRMPTKAYETIVNISNKETMPLNKQVDFKVNDKKLTVVGYYSSKYDYNYYLVNNNIIKYDLINSRSDLVVYSSNPKKTINDFRNLNLNIKDSYQKSKVDYKNSLREKNNSVLIVSGIMLLISLIEMYLMIRSSFLSRVKEIGIYRAIGVKKIDIYKMFYGEIFAITTLASVPGLIFMAYVLNILSGIKYFKYMFLINPFIIIISILFVYLFNLIIGLLPVFNVIRKTPAQILSRHDLD